MCIWSFFDNIYTNMAAIDYMSDQNKFVIFMTILKNI